MVFGLNDIKLFFIQVAMQLSLRGIILNDQEPLNKIIDSLPLQSTTHNHNRNHNREDLLTSPPSSEGIDTQKEVPGQTLTQVIESFTEVLLERLKEDDFAEAYLEYGAKHILALHDMEALPKLQRDLASLGFRDEFEVLGAGKDAIVFGCRNYCIKIYVVTWDG